MTDEKDQIQSFTSTEFAEIITGSNDAARAAFNNAFPRRIAPIAEAAAIAHRELARFATLRSPDERVHTVYLFLHGALNNTVTSTHLLVAGMPVASGHLMRHYAECIAMAMLCTDPGSGVLAEYSRMKTRYPVHKSTGRVGQARSAKRLRALLGFDKMAWQSFVQTVAFYDKFSHASSLSMAFQMMLNSPGQLIIGPEYDPGKRKELSKELTSRRNALRVLPNTIRRIRAALRTVPRHAGAAHAAGECSRRS